MPGKITFDLEITTTPFILEDGQSVGFVEEDQCFLYNYAQQRPDARELLESARKAMKRDPVAQRWLRVWKRRQSQG